MPCKRRTSSLTARHNNKPVVELLQQSPLLFAVTALLLGLLVGSFLNVVIIRLPGMMYHSWRAQCRELLELDAESEPEPPGLITPRSHCTSCGHAVTALENIPILSYFMLRGRCSACGAHISRRYPAIEALTGVCSVIVATHFGISIVTAAALMLTWGLIALSFIDIDHQILPDSITLPGIWLGLLLNLFGTFTDLQSAVIGALAGYLSLWVVFQLFKLVTGKEGMGFGDFKLFALFGAWLGWQLLPLIILLSALTGALIGGAAILIGGRDRQIPIPFGPYLAIAGWIAMLWGHELTQAYLRYTGLA